MSSKYGVMKEIRFVTKIWKKSKHHLHYVCDSVKHGQYFIILIDDMDKYRISSE